MQYTQNLTADTLISQGWQVTFDAEGGFKLTPPKAPAQCQDIDTELEARMRSINN